MPAPLVAPSDVETALLRALTTDEATYAPDLCFKATEMLRQAMPGVDDRIARYGTDDKSALSPFTVAAVLAGAIKRFLVNPTGATSISETAGPFSQTTGYGARPASAGGGAVGELAITEADLAKLAPPPPSTAASTIRTGHRRWR